MRKFFLFSLVIIVLPMISSCERDFEQDLSMQQITPSNTRSVNLLSFNSEEEMKAQAESLRLMDEESRVQWYNDHNFESQHTAMYRIIEEFEQAQSYEEALQMKEVYSQYFLFNNDPSEEELFNPYLPTSKSEYAFVCNIEGNVIINGEVVNYNTISNVCETAEYKLTHRDTRIVEEQLNYLYSEVGDRKFWAEGRLSSTEVVGIEFTARKKVAVLGWVKYRTVYSVSGNIKNNNWESFSPDFQYYFDLGGRELLTQELACGTIVEVGRLAFRKTATMTLFIFSRGTGEEGMGALNLAYTSTRATAN